MEHGDATLRQALDAAGVGTFVWRIPEDCCEPDARMLTLLGFSGGRTLSLCDVLSTLIHVDDRRRFADAFAAAIEPGGSGTLREEVRVLHEAGSVRWLSIIGRTTFEDAADPTPSTGDAGTQRALRMSGMAADITDRKQRELRLAFLDTIAGDCSLLSAPADFVRIVGARLGDYLHVNRFGVIEIDERRNEMRVLHMWTRPGTVSEVVHISDLGDMEFRCSLRAGEMLIVHDSRTDPRTGASGYPLLGFRSFMSMPFTGDRACQFMLIVGDDQPRHWSDDAIETFRAVTERLFPRLEQARAEQAVANDLEDTRLLQRLSAQLIEGHGSEALFDAIVDAAKAIMRSDYATMQMLHPERGLRGELRLVASHGFSDEAKEMWNWVRAEAGTTCALSLRTGARFIAADIAACEPMSGTEEQKALLEAGIRAAQSTPLVSRSGKTLGMITTHWTAPHHPSERDFSLMDILARQAADLMERAQAEDALRRSESQLKDADRRKDEFLATLAHELRNPLAPLRTSLELIRLAGHTNELVEEARLMMEEQVGVLVRLVDDLLDVSRITSGNVRLQRRPTPLAHLVAMAVQVNRAALDSANLELRIDVPDCAPSIDADPTRFVQILSNVLNNAIKFTDPGGRISIAAEVTRVADRDESEVALTVSDSGIGITAEMLPRVFDLFTQDETTAHRSQAGLGVGLPLARRLIELHGGSIEAHSDGTGRGSAFVLRMPVSHLPADGRPAAPAREAPRISRRVVVIDDNPSAARAMQRLVTVLGGQCEIAHDGETGLDRIRQFRPDFVILDIGMPEPDGYQTCRRARQEFGSDLVIVALTGWDRTTTSKGRCKPASTCTSRNRRNRRCSSPSSLVRQALESGSG